MGYFSNGTEGQMYQEKYCENCKYWVGDVAGIGSDLGCPIWQLHLMHVGDKAWQPALDKMIPMVPKVMNGIKHSFAGECSTYWAKDAPV